MSFPAPTLFVPPNQMEPTKHPFKPDAVCQTYACHVGRMVGLNRDNNLQAHTICEEFPGVTDCIPEQACAAYFPKCTEMYRDCYAAAVTQTQLTKK